VPSASSGEEPMLTKRSGHWAYVPPACGHPIVATNTRRRLRKGGNVHLFLHREEGQGLAEYGLIGSLIAVLAVFSLMFISGNLDHLLSIIGHGL
jgi:Flp pilus assembly pilin Flp